MELEVEFRPGVALRRQLEDALRVAIRSGRLPPGSVLPPTRDLAEQLDVSRGVVVDSYAQLATEGYLSARRGSGTRVAALASVGTPSGPAASPTRRITSATTCGPGRPTTTPSRAPGGRRRWSAPCASCRTGGWATPATAAPSSCGTPWPATWPGCGAWWWSPTTWSSAARPPRRWTCSGTRCGKNGGRRVAIEDPGWRWQRYAAEHAGLEAVPVRVDRDGLVVSELAAADVDAVVITPAHHYPTGVVMTAERRGALIAWARARGALIVEDDYDVEYRFGRDPVASLQGLAPDLVAFVGTTSKTLAPALRLAWVVPPSHLIDDVEDLLLVTGVTPPTLDQVAMASFIEEAALERHLRAMRRRYRAKRNILVGALGRAPARGPGQRHRGRAARAGLAARRRRRARPPPSGPAASASACTNCTGTATVHAPSPPALLLGLRAPDRVRADRRGQPASRGRSADLQPGCRWPASATASLDRGRAEDAERRREGGEPPDVPVRVVRRGPQPRPALVVRFQPAQVPRQPPLDVLRPGVDEHVDRVGPALGQVILQGSPRASRSGGGVNIPGRGSAAAIRSTRSTRRACRVRDQPSRYHRLCRSTTAHGSMSISRSPCSSAGRPRPVHQPGGRAAATLIPEVRRTRVSRTARAGPATRSGSDRTSLASASPPDPRGRPRNDGLPARP